MNKLEKNLTKRQLLKVLPEVREISLGVAIGKSRLNNITISKAQFKRILDIALNDEVLDKIQLLTLENGTFIIL